MLAPKLIFIGVITNAEPVKLTILALGQTVINAPK
jgi:hypothetical protein